MRDDELSMSWSWSRLWTRPPYVLSAAAAALVRKMQYLGRRTKWVPLTRTRRYRSPTTNVHLSACSCTHARKHAQSEQSDAHWQNQIKSMQRFEGVDLLLLRSSSLQSWLTRFHDSPSGWMGRTTIGRKARVACVRDSASSLSSSREERRGARDEATRAPRVQIALNNAENKTKEGEIHFQKNRVNRIERHGTRRQRMLVIKNWW